MTVIVRSATENDLGAADRVLRLAFGTQRGLPDRMTAFGDRDMIKARSRGGTSTILVVEEDSKILGTTALSRWGSVGYIGRMAVDSTHRLSLGDTVILQRGSTCRGFAICHVGAGTEAGNGFCY